MFDYISIWHINESRCCCVLFIIFFCSFSFLISTYAISLSDKNLVFPFFISSFVVLFFSLSKFRSPAQSNLLCASNVKLPIKVQSRNELAFFWGRGILVSFQNESSISFIWMWIITKFTTQNTKYYLSKMHQLFLGQSISSIGLKPNYTQF